MDDSPFSFKKTHAPTTSARASARDQTGLGQRIRVWMTPRLARRFSRWRQWVSTEVVCVPPFEARLRPVARGCPRIGPDRCLGYHLNAAQLRDAQPTFLG